MSRIRIGSLANRRLNPKGVGANMGAIANLQILDVRAPTAPVLGTPTDLAVTSMTVPLVTPATDIGGSGLATGLRQRATNAGFTVGVTTDASGALPLPRTSTGLSGTTTYYYRERNDDGAGNIGGWSAVVSATTASPVDITAPTAPTISATQAGSTAIAASLVVQSTDVGGSGIRDYTLEYKRNIDPGWTVSGAGLLVPDFPRNVSILTPSTLYDLRAKAYDNAGNEGPYSAIAQATTSSGGAAPNALYPGLDMALVPYHNAAGAYGPQLAFQTAAPPNITRNENAANLSQLQTWCNTPGTRITLTANIIGGNITGNMTDIEIVVPFGRLMSGTVFGSFGPPRAGIHTRVRFTKAAGDTIGGQLHWVQFYGIQARDIICDGLQVSVDTFDPGIPFFLAQDSVERVAILRNRIKSAIAGYGYGVPHLLIAGNSMLHNANATGNQGDWGYRISSSGPSIFFENDTRVPDNTPINQAYAPLRYHPRNGSELQYAWASDSTFVNLAEGRTFDCHDTEGSALSPNNIDAVWMLNSRFYVANGFTQQSTRSSPASGPTVDFFRINGNFLFGSTGPFGTGGAPNGDATGNTYSAALGTIPAWGPAGDPTGISLNP